MPPADVLAEIDAKVDVQKMEDQLMREGVAKFADPQKALLKLHRREAPVAGRSATLSTTPHCSLERLCFDDVAESRIRVAGRQKCRHLLGSWSAGELECSIRRGRFTSNTLRNSAFVDNPSWQSILTRCAPAAAARS